MIDPPRRHVLGRDDHRAADRRGAGPDPRRLLRRRGVPARGVRRLRRLVVGPAAVRGGRLPRRRQPRDPPGGDRPQARAGSSSTGQGARRPAPAAADRPAAVGTATPRAVRRGERERRGRVGREGAPGLAARCPSSAWPASRRRCRRPAATKLGPLEYAAVDEPELPGPGWQRVHTRLAGICGSDLSLVEGHASLYFDDWVSLPVRPRPRGRRRTRRRHAGDPRTGARPRGSRLRSPVRRRRARRRRRLRPPRHRPSRTRHPDRVLLLDRRRLGAEVRRPRAPNSTAIPDDMPDERAVLVEPIAGGIHAALLCAPTIAARQDTSGNRSSPCSAPARWASPRSPDCAGTCPTCGSSSAPATRTRRRSPSSSAPTSSSPPSELDRAVRRAAGCHVIGDHLSSGAHVTIDAVGNSASRHRLPAHHPPARAGRAARHAGRRDASTSPGSGTARPSSRAPTPTAPRRSPTAAAAARSTSPSRPPTPSRPSACCRPPIRSSTTSTPSPTPPPPAAAAP